MSQHIVNYSVKANEADCATLIVGPDNKTVATTDIPRIGHISEVRGVNAKNARYIAACLNACDGMSVDALENMPASFNTLLSDGFMHVIKMPEIAMAISDEEAKQFIEAWNATPRSDSMIVPMQHFVMSPVEVDQIAWLQKAHTLHRQVSMLYVVDGYEVTVTYDEHPISEVFHGETLREAISKAMAGHNLDAHHLYLDRLQRYPEDAQREAVEAQRDTLLETLKDLRDKIDRMSSDHWWINTPDRGGFDVDALDITLAEIEGGAE